MSLTTKIALGLAAWTAVSFVVGPLIGWWLARTKPEPRGALAEAVEEMRAMRERRR